MTAVVHYIKGPWASVHWPRALWGVEFPRLDAKQTKTAEKTSRLEACVGCFFPCTCTRNKGGVNCMWDKDSVNLVSKCRDLSSRKHCVQFLCVGFKFDCRLCHKSGFSLISNCCWADIYLCFDEWNKDRIKVHWGINYISSWSVSCTKAVSMYRVMTEVYGIQSQT